MVWGCFGAGKVGDLYKVKGILNKEGYHSILQRHAIPCGQRLIRANFLLQQDNDQKQTSKLCKNYLGKKQSAGILSVMEWPALLSCCGSSLTVWYVRSALLSQSNLWEQLQEAYGEISSDACIYIASIFAPIHTHIHTPTAKVQLVGGASGSVGWNFFRLPQQIDS